MVFLGGQYNHLIARRLRELGAKPLILRPWDLVEGRHGCVVAGGGPHRLPKDLRSLAPLAEYARSTDSPFLGICLSHQLLALALGGRVEASKTPEYGGVVIRVLDHDELFNGLPDEIRVWESHNDEVVEMPPGFRLLATSPTCRIQAMKHEGRPLYGVQFHPEVSHTQYGREILANFLEICRR